MVNKREQGIYLTQKNPFDIAPFQEWIAAIEKSNNSLTICEPYAGENHLLKHLYSVAPNIMEQSDIVAYDINADNENNIFPRVQIQQEDTLFYIPTESDLIITNPPYLGRNSARRRKIDFPYDYIGAGIERPQDLYQICLDTCLASCRWLAAIIPESFLTSKYSKSHLEKVISLKGDLFQDTDIPVCLALFSSNIFHDFSIYDNEGIYIGRWTELQDINNTILSEPANPSFQFNSTKGQTGLRGVDNSKEASIEFCSPEAIDVKYIKPSSRNLTRIYIPNFPMRYQSDIISAANEELYYWRQQTNDIYLTAFKGTRQDGKYRRRLSFKIANMILGKVLRDFQI